MNHELYLINLSGPDHPGVTASLMKDIYENNCQIIDIGQSITHGLLSLSLIVEPSAALNTEEFKQSLIATANKMSMALDFKPIERKNLNKNSDEKYIISCVSLQGIRPEFLQDITAVLAKNNINIERIDNVSGEKLVSLDIYTVTKESINWNNIKSELMAISNSHSIDLAMLKNDVWRKNKRLIVFDMDSTLIQSEVIVEMAKQYGVGEEVYLITEKAMNGEINFDESLIQRVALLKGMPEIKLKSILQNIRYTDGAEEFIQTVRNLGYKTAIISGGFNYFANAFKEELKIDYAFSNELEIIDGKLTGKVKGPIVNAEKKAILLELLAQQENINLEQVVAIGDGANDLDMLAKAGLGIAFHAKEIVKKTAKQHMSHGPMTSILYFLGIHQGN